MFQSMVHHNSKQNKSFFSNKTHPEFSTFGIAKYSKQIIHFMTSQQQYTTDFTTAINDSG